MPYKKVRTDLKALQPVVMLHESTVKLSNGDSFIVVHDFKKMYGAVNSFEAAINCWTARTEDYTVNDFCRYVKSKLPETICLSKKDYLRIVGDHGGGLEATKEEY